MYESFFGFDDTPFRLSADEKFRFEHENYLRASAYLAYALQQNEGFVMITGQPGSGKTTLVRDVVSEIDSSKFHVLNLVTSQLQAEELLRKVALEYGLPAETYNKATLLTGIHKHIAKLHEDGKQSILFLDEAQNLSTTGLEELRLLSNLQHGRNSLMQIVLIGHDELRSLVLGPGMEHIQQRLIAICQIKPMSPDQTRKYITHRLSKVGWRDDPQIQDDVFRLIHQAAQGVPRKINHLMSRLLLFAFLEEKHSLTEQDAFVVIEELVEENRITLSNGEDFEAFILRFQAEKEQLLVRQPEVVGLNVKQFKKQEEPLQVRGTGGVDQKVRSELATSTHIIAENLLLAIDESAQECEEAWDIPDSDWHNLESDLIAKKEISEKSAQVDRFTSNVKESIDKDLDDHDDSVEYQQPASLFSTDEIWDDKLDPKVDKSAHFDSLSDRRTGQFDPLSDLKMTDQASAEDDHQWGGVWWMSNQGGQGGERRSAADNYDSRPQRSERESGFVRHDKRSNTIQVDENLSMPSVWVDGCPEGVPRQNNEVHTFNPKPAGRGGIVRFLYYVISFVVIGFVVFLGLQFFPNAIDSYWRGVPSGADRPESQGERGDVYKDTLSSVEVPKEIDGIDSERQVVRQELSIESEPASKPKPESEPKPEPKPKLESKPKPESKPKLEPKPLMSNVVLRTGGADVSSYENIELATRYSVYFDFNKSTIPIQHMPLLKSIQYKMLLEENSFLRITGYADAQGDMDYNYLLSLKRAKEVKKFFLLRGIDGDRLQVGAVGSVGGRGLESGQTGREIRSGKRRVEVILFPK